MIKWKNIIIHHSASNWGSSLLIDGWHKQKDFNCIGYHFVILNGFTSAEDYHKDRRFDFLEGSIEMGRTLDGDEWVEWNETGAHALGFNKNSIGICLIHKDEPYSFKMINSLLTLLEELIIEFQIEPDYILGHYELDKKKPLCPGLDMQLIRNLLKIPSINNI